MESSSTWPSLGPPSTDIADLVGLHFPLGHLSSHDLAHDRFVPESPRWLISKGSVSFLFIYFRLRDVVKQHPTTGEKGSANTCSLPHYRIR